MELFVTERRFGRMLQLVNPDCDLVFLGLVFFDIDKHRNDVIQREIKKNVNREYLYKNKNFGRNSKDTLD